MTPYKVLQYTLLWSVFVCVLFVCMYVCVCEHVTALLCCCYFHPACVKSQTKIGQEVRGSSAGKVNPLRDTVSPADYMIFSQYYMYKDSPWPGNAFDVC